MEKFNGYDYLGELVYEFIYDNDIVCDDYVVYFEMKYEHEKEYELCTIYNSNDLPEFNKEKDLILYYEKLLSSKDMIVLPKLKNQKAVSYQTLPHIMLR